jgi:hypothetical protein
MGFTGRDADLLAAALAAGRVTLVGDVGVNAATLTGRYATGLPLPEAAFQLRVIDLAHGLGWRVAHFRAVRVQRLDGSVFYETPVAADGEGFTDLELVRERLVKAELKSDTGRMRPAQEQWRDAYLRAGVEWYLWRPGDWNTIEKVLA